VLFVGGLVGGVLSERLRGGEAWAQAAIPNIVEAKRFHVVDDDGNLGMWLGVDANGSPGIGLHYGGESRAQLKVIGDAVGLMLNDNTGKTCAQLTVGDSGPTLVIRNPEGGGGAQLDITEGTSRLRFADIGGKPRLELGTVWDPLLLEEPGAPYVTFNNMDGNARLRLEELLGGRVTIIGEDERVIWQAP